MKTLLENTKTGKIALTKSLIENRPINETFVQFIEKLTQKFGEPTSKEFSKLVHNEYRGMRRVPIVVNYKTKCVEFSTSEYRLVFCPASKGSIEIYKIEVKNQGRGIGGELMNTILDVCDSLGVNCQLIPVGDFVNQFSKTTPTDILLKWYASFGFKKSVLSNYFIYRGIRRL
jgi:GNAT superfamily N-acetyltransferase